jgi:hypothetical protein
LPTGLCRLFIVQILDPLLVPEIKPNPVPLHLDIDEAEGVAAGISHGERLFAVFLLI